MFAIQNECHRARPQLRVISNPNLETKPMLKAIWEKADGQLVRRWTRA